MQMIWMRITNVINPLKGHHQSQVKLLKIKLFMKVVKKAIYVAVALFCLNLTVSVEYNLEGEQYNSKASDG